MPPDDFLIRLRDEIREHQNKRHQFSIRKLSFATVLLGAGAVSAVGGSPSFDTSFLLYLAPFVAIAFDLYIVSEDYRVKRAGDFLTRKESGVDGAEWEWERFVKNNPNRWACYAFALVTGVVIASSSMVLLVASPPEWQWGLVACAGALVSDLVILKVSLSLRKTFSK